MNRSSLEAALYNCMSVIEKLKTHEIAMQTVSHCEYLRPEIWVYKRGPVCEAEFPGKSNRGLAIVTPDTLKFRFPVLSIDENRMMKLQSASEIQGW